MTVNGNDMPVDEQGTVPVIVNGRTLLPVRAVVEQMGGTVDWNGETQEVTLIYGEDEIKLTIGSTEALLNGEKQTLDVAPTVTNGRTMLPIRFIAESFKFNVSWNGDEQRVTITNSKDIDDTTVSDNLVMINGGKFIMGSSSDEPECSTDELQHEVTVDSFYLSKTEVTQSEYEIIMGNNPSDNKDGENLPVENVTWYDAISYCNELSKAENLTPCYTIDGDTVIWDRSANGYRLPT